MKASVNEIVTSSFTSHTWPSALVLSAYLIQEKQEVCGKRVLELGAGTALVSVVAAMLGAGSVGV